MVKVVIRHVTWDEGVEVGEFTPQQANELSKLIADHGVVAEGGNEDSITYDFQEAVFDLDKKQFEIVVG